MNDLKDILKNIATHAASGTAEAAGMAVWDIRSFLLQRKAQGDFDFDEVRQLFEAFRHLPFPKPHRYYSVLLDTMLQVREANGDPWPGAADFIEWWGLENLLEEDFHRQRLTNGQTIPSVAERAYSTYYQSLKAEVEEGRRFEQASEYVEMLDRIISERPEFSHSLYHKTRLLKALGRRQEAISSAAGYVKNRPADFWGWSMLGDLAEGDELQLACYCRALTSRTDARFLAKVKQKAAAKMLGLGFLAEAKHELEDIQRIYASRKWRLAPEVEEIINQPWWDETYATQNNTPFYAAHAPGADALLYTDVPETPVMITNVNPLKQTAGFVTADQRRGYFSTRQMPQKFGEYHIYRVRFDGEIPETRPSKILSMERETDAALYEGIFYRHETGELKWRPGQAFGFVGTTFIDGRLLGDWASTGIKVELTAVIYWHIKSGQWAWKAVTIRPALA